MSITEDYKWGRKVSMDLKQIEIIHYEGRNRLKKNEQHLKGIWDNMIGNYKCLIEILEEKEIEN